MSVPNEMKYTESHEWVKEDGNLALVGITDFAQGELGELVFCDLPAIGKSVKKGDTLCVVESTKAASDVYAPISGKVVAVNDGVSADPALVNRAPFSDGWLVKLEPSSKGEVAELLSAQQYQEKIGG